LYGNDFNFENGIYAVYGNPNVILWVSDAGDEQGETKLPVILSISV